jgi:hypothetical protein
MFVVKLQILRQRLNAVSAVKKWNGSLKQGCQIFLGPKYQKRGKNYQIITKYTK